MRELLGLLKHTDVSSYLGTNGALVVDTDTGSIFFQDGVTVGGIQITGYSTLSSVTGNTEGTGLPIFLNQSNNDNDVVLNFTSLIPGNNITLDNVSVPNSIIINAVGTPIVDTNVISTGSSYSVSATEYCIIVNKTIGSATSINLRSSPVTGTIVIIKDGKGDSASNNITIVPAAGNIDGSSSYVINQAYQSVTLIYNGSSWSII
jgi:hypothetical protein